MPRQPNDDMMKQIAELMDSKLSERDKAADRERKRKEDPWSALSDLIDERIDFARKRDLEDEEKSKGRRRSGGRQDQGDDDDDGDGDGFFAKILGGGA